MIRDAKWWWWWFCCALGAVLTLPCEAKIYPKGRGLLDTTHFTNTNTLDARMLLQSKSTSVSGSNDERNLQDILFTATYIAQFQVFQHALCGIPQVPILRVSCKGPNIKVLSTSSTSINCSSTPAMNNGWWYLQCINTCDLDTTCADVFLANSELKVEDGPFGNITFQCASSDIVENVDAVVSFEKSDQALCQANEYIFRVLRMGVQCPVASNSDSGRAFLFDDYFFECGEYYSFSEPGEAETGYLYRCASGNRCDEDKACKVNFFEQSIRADLPNFASLCVETSNNAVISPPAPSPISTTNTFILSARFEAGWGLLLDPAAVSTCVWDAPIVKISCLRGELERLDATSSVICDMSSNKSEMNCTDNSKENYVGQFANVTYKCSGFSLPGTKVEYLESIVSCNQNTATATVQHGVQLGVTCTGDSGEYVTYIDDYVDCTSQDHVYLKLNQQGDTDFDDSVGSDRFTCVTTSEFPPGSTTDQSQNIAAVGISTDFLTIVEERQEDFDYCYDRTQISAMPPSFASSPVMVGSTPTMVQGSYAPNIAPQQSLSDAIGSSGSNNSVAVGVAVGGTVAIVAVIAICAFLVARRRRSIPSIQKHTVSHDYDRNGSSAAANNDGAEHSDTEAVASLVMLPPSSSSIQNQHPLPLSSYRNNEHQSRSSNTMCSVQRLPLVHVTPVLSSSTALSMTLEDAYVIPVDSSLVSQGSQRHAIDP